MHPEPLTTGRASSHRILIVDDHPLFRGALRDILSSHPELEVVAEAADGQEALELSRRLQPELVLMDLRMPGMDGISATWRIKSELPTTIVLMLTAAAETDSLSKALRAGAGGYILKYAGTEEILAAIRAVLSGESPIDHRLGMQLLKRLLDQTQKEAPAEQSPARVPPEENKRAEASVLESLSPRELEVLKLMGRGQTNQQIAQSLFVSVNTVKKHVQRVISKLGVSDRLQAAVVAIELGLYYLD